MLALKRSPASSPRINLIAEPLWLQKEMMDVTIDDLKSIDVLVHLAAHSANVPYDSLQNCIQKNVVEPLALFNTAFKAGVKNYVAAGSCFEYGTAGERYDFIPPDAPLEPTQSYPASKAMASIAFRQFAIENGVNLSFHRIFQVYGEGELETRLWPSLRKAALAGEDFPMTKGEQVRDFIHVGGVAEKLLEATIKLEGPKNYYVNVENLGSGTPQTVLEFCQYWWKKWNAKGQLLIGAKPYCFNEVVRYVPHL